jgi:hypothetical protein
MAVNEEAQAEAAVTALEVKADAEKALEVKADAEKALEAPAIPEETIINNNLNSYKL